jgi:hypothetical protein
MIRTPEQYWETLLRAFPPGIPDSKIVAFRRTFFSGMSAMVSLMAELRESPLGESEKQALYRRFAEYIHRNDGLEEDSRTNGRNN